jgi:hypothetical protein
MRADAYAFCHLIAEIRSFHSFFYSFTNRQGLFPRDVLRQKGGLPGSTSLSSRVSSTSKKPLRVVRLSLILEGVKTFYSYGLSLLKFRDGLFNTSLIDLLIGSTERVAIKK